MKISPNNSRVCFIGDSITHKNGYVSYVFDYYVQKYKQSNVKFFNCGISGATAKQQIELIDDDILLYDPTHAVIMPGVNDSRHPLLGGKLTLLLTDSIVCVILTAVMGITLIAVLKRRK